MGWRRKQDREAVLRADERPGIARLLRWQQRAKVGDGFEEVAAAYEHGEVDRVEVDLTPKTSTEVGVGFDRRECLAAVRTHEDEAAVAVLTRPSQVLDQPFDWYVVADPA